MKADNSFSKNFRLRSAQDFSYLRTNSKRIDTPWIRVYYKDSRTSLDETRIGLSVSKKVGKANKRNRFKRILREQFRLSECKYLAKDVLIIVSPRIFKRFTDAKDSEKALISSFNEALRSLSRP